MADMDADGDRDARQPAGQAAKWLSAIEQAQQAPAYAEWAQRCKKIRDRYRYESSSDSKARRYQVLWSNMETMKPAVYAKPPHGVVSRRYRDQDKVGRQASEILERGVNFTLDANDFDDDLKQVCDDFLLYARGVARIKYEPVFVPADPETTDTLDAADAEGVQTEAKEDQASDAEDVLDFEHVKIEYVQRKDFVHEPARTWKECNWVAFRAFLSREALVKRFGDEIGNAVGLDASMRDVNDAGRSETDDDKATVWEIWDKAGDRVLWVAAAYPNVLEESEPYLKLDGFYPCPKPAYGTMTTDSLVPVPDFVFYQDQAEEIDVLTARIAALAQSLKLVGFYPAGPHGEGAPEIERAIKPGVENVMIAVNSWAAFREGGGAAGAPIIWLPITQVADILKACVELRKQLLDDVNQIAGISDIMRGDGDAQETATAQSIKAQYGSIRVRQRQKEMARFCRDVCRMVAQVIAQQFQPEALEKMTNVKLPSQADVDQANQQQTAQFQQVAAQYQQVAMQAQQSGQQPPPPPQPPAPVNLGPTVEDVFGLLRDSATRRFRIDIETDSTIAGDESQERADRSTFIETTTKFVEAWGQIVQQQPGMAPLAGALLLFGVRAFRVGRELEETIEETVDQLQQLASQPKPPNPQMMAEQQKAQAVQTKAQAEIQKANIGAQADQADAQAKMQIAQMKMQQAQMDHEHKTAAHQMNMQKLEAEMQMAYQQAQQQQAQQMQAPQQPPGPATGGPQ